MQGVRVPCFAYKSEGVISNPSDCLIFRPGNYGGGSKASHERRL